MEMPRRLFSSPAFVKMHKPTTIQIGIAATPVGKGILDEQVTGGTFNAVIKASAVQVASYSGDASKSIVSNLPLGTRFKQELLLRPLLAQAFLTSRSP